MKYFTFSLLFLFTISLSAQKSLPVNVITDDLQEYMSTVSDNELIPVNIRLTEKYPSDQLLSKVKGFSKSERREFVVNELKNFTKQSQAEIREFLDIEALDNEVEDIHYFWITNVISCKTSKDIINILSKNPEINRIDHDESRNLLANRTSICAEQPNPKEITYNVLKVNAPDVWNEGYTGQGVIVAVIDVGVNYNHLDLESHMWTSLSYPYHGYDFANNDNNPMDIHGHGTHCAGTVAGDGTAGSQTGMAPNALIMAVKTLDDFGGGPESDSWAGFEFSVDNGADIISFSVGWQHSWNPDRETWRNILDNTLAAGVIASIAAGNEGGTVNNPDNVRTPGDCPPPWLNPDQTLVGGISANVCVGATNSADQIANFSCRGPSEWEHINPYNDYPFNPEMGLLRPDVCAPGVDIKSCNASQTNGYTVMSGTSMATPGVAGVMALLLSKSPDLTPEALNMILETTSVDLGASGKDNIYGAGRIDAFEAYNQLLDVFAPTDLQISTDQQSGNSALNWNHTQGSGFTYYKIYRDGVAIDSVTSPFYQDQLPDYGYYTYEISAVYFFGSIETDRIAGNTQWGSSEMIITPESISAILEPDGTEQQLLTIKNTGVLDLDFQLLIFDANPLIVEWCTVDPENGMIAVGDSLIVTLTFDSENYEVGYYEDTLSFTSNELNGTTHDVLITMIVDFLEINAISNSNDLCIGQSTQLWAEYNGGLGDIMYSWTSMPEGFTSSEADPQITPLESTMYHLTISDDYIQSLDSVFVEVHQLPVVSLGDDQVLCDVTSYSLDAGNPGLNYLWSTGENTQSIMATGTGLVNFWVEVSDSYGCSQSDTVEIMFAENPVVELGADTNICEDAIIVLDAGNPGSDYLWSTEETSQSITVDAMDYVFGVHEFYVEVLNDFECIGMDTISVEFENCAGVDEISNNISVTIYPNPNHGIFNLKFDNIQNGNINLKVYSVSGVVVYSESDIHVSGNMEKQIKLGHLNSGIYYISIATDASVLNRKIIIEK